MTIVEKADLELENANFDSIRHDLESLVELGMVLYEPTDIKMARENLRTITLWAVNVCAKHGISIE